MELPFLVLGILPHGPQCQALRLPTLDLLGSSGGLHRLPGLLHQAGGLVSSCGLQGRSLGRLALGILPHGPQAQALRLHGLCIRCAVLSIGVHLCPVPSIGVHLCPLLSYVVLLRLLRGRLLGSSPGLVSALIPGGAHGILALHVHPDVLVLPLAQAVVVVQDVQGLACLLRIAHASEIVHAGLAHVSVHGSGVKPAIPGHLLPGSSGSDCPHSFQETRRQGAHQERGHHFLWADLVLLVQDQRGKGGLQDGLQSFFHTL